MTTETRAPHHDELNDELNAYLDGQLDAAREMEVAAHVASCALCADEIEQLRVTRTAMRELPMLRAPRTFVVAASEPVVRWRGLLAWGWRIGSVASAACVLIAALSTSGGEAPVRTNGGSAESSASLAKSEAPAAAAPPAASGRATGELAGLAAQDAASNRAPVPAPAQAPGVAPVSTQAQLGDSSRETSDGRQSVQAPAAPPSRATVWIVSALLLAAVSAYAYTLDRRARAD